MRSLLAGNGVIIQYGGRRYLNSSIIQRALANVRSGRHPQHLYPRECAQFIEVLQREHVKVLRGEYDQYVAASFERASLEDFKRRYSADRSYSAAEIGFEDYFLMFELVFNKQGVGNPDRYHSRGVLKRMFLDAIYDEGRIEEVHESFPVRFVSYLRRQDHIFTTNYDSNLEEASGKEVHHLHGAFRVLSDVYNPNSFKRQVTDDILDGEVVDPDFPYLYSNCLVSYVGDLKSFSMKQSAQANSAMEKFAKGYVEDQAIRKEIESWPEDNTLTKRLKEAIKLKAQQPDLEHEHQYPHEMLSQIDGQLEILGLSPSNDSHLFAQIIGNANISEIVFHSFTHQEEEDARRLFRGKSVVTRDAREFWEVVGDGIGEDGGSIG